MLKIKSVSKYYPVWELSGFETSELNISFPKKGKRSTFYLLIRKEYLCHYQKKKLIFVENGKSRLQR